MQRREFLKISATAASLFPFMHMNQKNVFNTTNFMDVEVIKINIGKISCIIFRDLSFKYLAKDFFINANSEDLNEALKKYGAELNNIPSPFIAVLLEQNNRKILIDTGIGFSEKPILFRGNSYEIKGRLHKLLEQQNIKKEDITDIIITHFHPDHVGGICTEYGSFSFPNARFHMHEDEWSYWHSSRSNGQPDMFKFFIERNITKLSEKDLHLLKGDFVELLPGITSVKADGHTPGQIALIIKSEGENLLYISDAFLHPLHVEQLDWQTNYDLDHQKAKLSRIKLLELAHKNNMLVNAFHFDFPGLGRVDKHHGKWIWNYSKK